VFFLLFFYGYLEKIRLKKELFVGTFYDLVFLGIVILKIVLQSGVLDSNIDIQE
jgi:hypothetical protein